MSRHREEKEGQPLRGWRCARCGEVFFTATELIRWEVLTGRRRRDARRVRKVGGSLMVTLPESIAEGAIHESDFALFRRERGRRLIIDIIHPEA
ncbi:MAG TPA: hypothetical protein VI893_01030 [Thermoplasmata archaeon]|nr:hypothetical protein [Thermoplasmata archaeon]